MIDWRVGLTAWVLFLVLVILTRYVSLGSIAAAASFPVTSAVIYRDGLITLFGVFLGGLVIWKHRANIVRLVKGTESKFTLHKKKPAEASAETPVDEPPEEPAEAAPEEPAETASEEPEEAPADAPAPEEPEDAPAGEEKEDGQ